MNRRRFLQRSLAAGAAASVGVSLYTWRVEPHRVQFVSRLLPITGLPADLHGRLLVQLSDLHIGPQVDDAYIIRTLERTAALRPHFVVFTGDFVTYDADNTAPRLEAVLRHFPHGRNGTVAILGNHDYGPGWSQPDLAARIAAVASSAGLTVLRNTSVMLDGLQIMGLDDLWARQFAPARAFAEADASAPTIVLSHNPDTVDLPAWASYRGWILCGHTHGGQCKPPFLPPPLLPVQNRRYTAGEFALSGDRRLYINRGVGHLLRVRFNARPEVTVFRLQRA
jgi:predicted MPP superfamily phosphohydrolase